MSILNGQAVATVFNARQPLVDNNGIPTTTVGSPFLRALYNRGGGGSGITPSVSGPLKATGAAAATALGLTFDWNNITGGPGGVIISPLLKLQPGNDIWVFNGSGGNINVYPDTGSVQIDLLGPGNPFILGSGKLRCFQRWTSTQYHTYGN